MIDQTYQAEITKNLDDQQRRPSQDPAPAIPLFKNFTGGTGGAVAGPLQAGAAWADVLKGYGDVTAAGGASSGGGMFALPSDDEAKQNAAARDKLMAQGLDLNSATGAALRTRAKAFMPDPQTTGKAGVLLAGVTDFAAQAVPAAAAGPAGLVSLATERGVQKAQDLQEQGVDVNTRTAAGIASGTLDAASMLLPMTGPTRLIAAGKGAVGGAAIAVVQTEAEKLILQQGGYDKLASTYDPFDPVSIALSSLVPAAFGALHAPAGAAKPAGAARAEPVHADVTLSPAEQAHSDAMEASTLDTDIASLQHEIAGQHDEGAKQVLQTELARLQKQKAGGPARLDPDVEAAARVTQAAQALDRSRLTPDDDIVGHDQHQQAVETAADQIARGAPVDVTNVIGTPKENFDRWFGESKLRDEAGNPQVMYHGTAQDFDSFTPRQANAIFVGDHPVIAEAYAHQSAKWMAEHGQDGAPSITPLFVKAEHPFDYENPAHVSALAQRLLASGEGEKSVMRAKIEQLLKDGDWDLIESPETQAAIKALGHDAFYVNESGLKNLGVYDARNLKSAIGNSGRFDPASGSLTDPVSALGQAVDRYRAERTPPEAPAKPDHAAFNEARAESEGAAPAPPKGPRETSQAPDGAAAHPGPAANHLEASVAEVLRANPDLMVHMDGMEAPMRAADLLEAVRQSAAEDAHDASLLEVAAQCAISL